MIKASDDIVARKINPQADIVFCVDSTSSMAPCIEAIKATLWNFSSNLQSEAMIDYRLRLISYRDLHDKTSTAAWVEYPFTSDTNEFQKQLSSINTTDTQIFRGAESTLDALYRAIKSDWRPSKTHKTIILFTDDDTHPTLHESTYKGRDNNVNRVIQEFREMANSLLFLIAPEYPLYAEIEKILGIAGVDVIAEWVPRDDARYRGLQNVKFDDLMSLIGQLVSSSTQEMYR